MSTHNVTFEEWEAERLQDPEFREALEKLEVGFQVTQLRVMRGLTQRRLAKLVGTWQPSIARLESGRMEPRVSFLRRVVKALRARLEIRIVPEEEGTVIESLTPAVWRQRSYQQVTVGVAERDSQEQVGAFPPLRPGLSTHAEAKQFYARGAVALVGEKVPA